MFLHLTAVAISRMQYASPRRVIDAGVLIVGTLHGSTGDQGAHRCNPVFKLYAKLD